MKVNKENEEQIINFGVFGYNYSKISNILNVPEPQIKEAMDDKNSDFYKLFQKGIDVADYVIDLKLFEMAKTGDIKALEKFEIRKQQRKIN